MAGPRRRFTRRVLPALLIIAILGLGSRVGGGGDGVAGAGAGAGVASAREDLTRLDEERISVGTTPSSPRVRAGLGDRTAIVDGTDPSPPSIPPRAASKSPPPARKESAGRAWNLGTTTKSKTTKSKSTELVAGIAALEVDHRPHAADDEAARAIANAGKQTSGYADALDTSKIVFATFVSNGFHEFMLNWFEHTKRLGVDNGRRGVGRETEALCVARGSRTAVRTCGTPSR